MYRTAATLSFVSLLAVAGCDCDGSKPTVEETRQTQKQAEGEAWRSLLSTLNDAPDDAARVTALEQFVEKNPEHPDIADAKNRLDKFRESVEAKRAFESVKAKGVEEGDPLAFGAFLASEAVGIVADSYKVDDLSEPSAVPGGDGVTTVERAILLPPTRVRAYTVVILKEHAPDLVEERCFEECFNAAVNKVFEKSFGRVFVDRGTMNPDAVGPILETGWIEPDATLMGVPAKTFYDAFRATPRAYKRVGVVVDELDPEAAADELQGLDGARKVNAFYSSFARDNEIAERADVAEREARAIAGWWLRRHADGTAKSFDDYLTKVLEAYDVPDEWQP